ncbi:hypothetical protein B5807_02390 [Epicoccum nigrum]|uniref:Uncharacterized protein n=1 Tax=Epicoccum nigrum TaxID=105696 RepID=A0A1Y2MAB3_EPING|nr:hypothetical protein B5807_02390 [Epicoccum nigrum]
MHLSAVLLDFAATVAAIEFRLYDNANCNGGYLEWRNVDPGMCIAYDRDDHSSGEWRAIPYDWHINVGIYKDGGCKTLVASSDVYNQNTKCLSAPGRVLTAGRYHFVNKRRSIRNTCEVSSAPEAVQEQCTEQGPPPQFAGLVDGTLYNIEGLSTDLVDTLVSFTKNGSTAADVPEVFQNLVVDNPPSARKL